MSRRQIYAAGHARTLLINRYGSAVTRTVPFEGLPVHGPFVPPCRDCGAVVAYGGHNVGCPAVSP